MSIEQYLDVIKSIQECILEYLDKEDNTEEYYQNIIQLFIDHNILEKTHEIQLIFRLLSEISDNHHRYPGFFDKIEKLIVYFKDEIKENFTNSEFFEYFSSNKRILLFLIEEKIIYIDNDIIDKMVYLEYDQYFNPEIKQFIDQNKIKMRHICQFADENEVNMESSDNYNEKLELELTSEERGSQETGEEDLGLYESENLIEEEEEEKSEKELNEQNQDQNQNKEIDNNEASNEEDNSKEEINDGE